MFAFLLGPFRFRSVSLTTSLILGPLTKDPFPSRCLVSVSFGLPSGFLAVRCLVSHCLFMLHLQTHPNQPRFCPDKCQHLSPLADHLTWRQLRDRFGVAAPMLSCWACLLGQVPERMRDVFAKPTLKLRVVGMSLVQRTGIYPTPRTIAEEALRQSPTA